MARPRSVREQVGIDPSDEEVAAAQEARAQFAAAAADEENGRPAWLPDRFETPEAFAESFSALETDRGRLANEVGQLRDQMSEFALAQAQAANQQPQQQYDPNQDPLIAQYQAAVDMGDARAQLAITAYVAQMAAQQAAAQYAPPQQQQGETIAALAEMQVGAQYGERWQELRNGIGDLLQEHPGLVPTGADLTETVRGLSFAASIVAGQQPAQQQVQQDNGRQAKLLAQTATGGGGRQQVQLDPADALVELMKANKNVSYGSR